MKIFELLSYILGDSDLSASTNGGVENRGGVEVAEPCRWRSNMHGLVGRFDVKRMPIGVAVNGDCLNPESLGGPHDPAGYFASVRYQNLLYSPRLRGREISYCY